MKRSENRKFFRYLYDVGWLETMEFVFCDDIVVDYGDALFGIHDIRHNYFIAWHEVAGKY